MAHFADLVDLIPQFEVNPDNLYKLHISEKRVDGGSDMPYYEYANVIDEWWRLLYQSDDWDATTCYSVLETKRLDAREILGSGDFSHLDIQSVLALMTWITRRERFGEGTIAGFLRDGSILHLLKTLDRLINDSETKSASNTVRIIKADITTLKVDAVVNAANMWLREGGGVCGAIFKAAGKDDMRVACQKLAPIETGEAVITPGFKLTASYVIHTAGPIWHGGNDGEEKLLRACYRNSLKLAVSHTCRSIAFPLISSGIYGYPRDQALAVAMDEIDTFLVKAEYPLTAWIAIL